MKRALYSLLLLLPALALAEPVTLRLKQKVGDVTRHSFTIKMTVENEPFSLLTEVQHRVAKVSDDQSLEIEEVVKYLTMVSGSETIDLTTEADNEPEESTLTFAANGQLTKSSVDEEDETLYRFADCMQFIAPEKAVEVGAKWSANYVTEKRPGAVAGSINFVFAAKEEVGGFSCAKVTFESKESEGDKPATGTGTFWIRITDGVLVQMNGKFSNLPFGEPVDAEVESKLIP